MPFTHANPTEPTAEDPLAVTNTMSAPDPNTEGDLAAAIALLAQTLAAQHILQLIFAAQSIRTTCVI